MKNYIKMIIICLNEALCYYFFIFIIFNISDIYRNHIFKKCIICKCITCSELLHITDIYSSAEIWTIWNCWHVMRKNDSTQFEEIIPTFYECSRANASRVTNTNDYYRTPFEGETVIIMIILELGGTRPSRNKLQVCLLRAVDIAP